MAVQSVSKKFNGPVWPLGMIQVAAAGTPVSIMSLVDAALKNDPGTVSSFSSPGNEYTQRAYAILFTACKPAGHGVANNTGNIYIMLKAQGAGAGNRDDYGSMVYALPPGTATAIQFPTFLLQAAPLNRNVYGPYDYLIDADNVNDGCLVSLIIQ